MFGLDDKVSDTGAYLIHEIQDAGREAVADLGADHVDVGFAVSVVSAMSPVDHYKRPCRLCILFRI